MKELNFEIASEKLEMLKRVIDKFNNHHKSVIVEIIEYEDREGICQVKLRLQGELGSNLLFYLGAWIGYQINE